MRNVTEIQQRLIALEYLPAKNAKGERNDDGKFGTDSLDAYNHFRATMGKGPLLRVSMDELNADLFPTEQRRAPMPRSNPITDFFTGLAIKAALNKLKGSTVFNKLTGFKTIATGIISIGIGLCDIIGWDIPNTGGQSGGLWVAAGLAMIFGRLGLAKVAEDIIANIGK